MASLPERLHAALESWTEPSSVEPGHALPVLELAESLIADPTEGEEERALWHRYLDCTGRPDFLVALPDREARERWSETTFAAVMRSGYSLRRSSLFG